MTSADSPHKNTHFLGIFLCWANTGKQMHLCWTFHKHLMGISSHTCQLFISHCSAGSLTSSCDYYITTIIFVKMTKIFRPSFSRFHVTDQGMKEFPSKLFYSSRPIRLCYSSTKYHFFIYQKISKLKRATSSNPDVIFYNFHTGRIKSFVPR